MTYFSNKSLLLAGCGLAILATPAMAQESADEGDNTIYVTAQNRTEDVQDVPIAMDVIGGGELAAAGFNSANDLTAIAPAVQVNQDQGTVKITLRGIGTNSNDEAQDTSVVANIDGEYINRPNVLGIALFDLDRVEVLRGPQGTLYGRNSTAGAINFITRRPGNDFGFNASASYGNYDAIRLDAGIDIPVGDIGGLRFAGFWDRHDGYVNHPAGWGFGPFPAFAGGSSDTNNSYGGRTTLFLDTNDGLTFQIAAEYAQRKFIPQAFATVDLNATGNGPTGPGCNATGYEQVAPAYSPLVLCVPSQTTFLENLDRSQYASPGFGLGLVRDETWAVRGRLAYEFSPEATLSYIAGIRGFSANPNNFVTLPVVYRSFTFLDEAETQSHELRLNGEFDNGIVYQVGGFYFRETLDRENGFNVPLSPNTTFLSYFGRNVVSDSWSVFGQVEVPLTETLTAVGGIRYTDNERSALYKNASPFGAGPPDCFLLGPDANSTNCLFDTGPGRKDIDSLPYLSVLNLGSNDSRVTWLAGLNYEPNPDTLIYAKVSTGFKGGGFDSVGTYAPETNTAYEVGGKFTFGDQGQFQFNPGVFYYDYSGLQVSVLLDTTVGGQTFNAGAATIWGIEADFQAELTENTVFDLSVNYLNTQYDELFAQFNVFCVGCDLNGIGDLDPNTAGVQSPNFAGNRAPFSPEWVIRAGLRHTFDLGGSGSLTAAASTTYKSSYFTSFYNYSDGRQSGYTQTDLSLDWRSANDTFGVQLFARNLENERPLTYGGFTSAGSDDVFNWQFGTPRTYGVRLSVDY
ncbi:MAG: TonB-dependent receptor [Erythrobacter sp.]|nr:TonB-dependent receptor [Erythrobacter sp.]